MSAKVKSGRKLPLEEAKVLCDAGDKLNITCPEYKDLRAALRLTRGWLLRVKKCGAGDQEGQASANLVTELINEHSTFLVTASEELGKLKQVMVGYCVCRNPYEGFMIGCDGCEEWYHGPCVGITQEQAQKTDKYVCVRCSTLRIYKDNAGTVANILRKWTSAKDLAKSRSGDSQRYGRKVRSAERDIVKGKAGLENLERELKGILGVASIAPPPQMNGQLPAAAASVAPPAGQGTIPAGAIPAAAQGVTVVVSAPGATHLVPTPGAAGGKSAQRVIGTLSFSGINFARLMIAPNPSLASSASPARENQQSSAAGDSR